MGEGGHCRGRGLYIFVWTGEWGSSRTCFFVHKRIVSAVRGVHEELSRGKHTQPD
jgi:hypothetical protein